MRHTTTGCDKPWLVAKGYQHQSRYSSRWENTHEPISWLTIAAPILLAVLAVSAGLIVHDRDLCSEDCR